MEWQTTTALTIVAITLCSLLYSSVKSGKKSGCGSDCGCDLPKKR
ncbi:FeoB-associated Cys-rich membrane protein [Luteolibacter sp. AS25]